MPWPGLRPGLAGTLSLALALGPTPAAGAPSSDDLARAQALYDEGRALYEVDDYEGALERWSEAYGLVSQAEENDRTRYELLYSIALAHDRAYAQDRDPAHLRKAKDLLVTCQGAVAQVFAGSPDDIAEEQKRIRALLNRVFDQMGSAGTTSAPAPAPAPPPPASQPAPAPTPAPALASAPAPAPEDTSSGRGLAATGIALVALGGAGLGLMIGGMVVAQRANDFEGLDPGDLEGRADQIRRGRTGNALSAAGAAVGAAGIAVGIPLLVLGRTRMKASLAATASRGGVGLTWRGSF
jgi:hypothetical protein